MSCYEWEYGKIKLSTREYPRVKREFLEKVKAIKEQQYKDAVKLYEKMIAEAKNKRKINWRELYYKHKEIKCENPNSWALPPVPKDLDMEDIFLNANGYFRTNKRPLKPKKKDYLLKIKRKNALIQFEDACIYFVDADRIIIWEVNENNHAVDRANAHPYSRALFGLLNRVNWTRGTGGEIVGNDEYAREEGGVGGGGNYLVTQFGPKAKPYKYKPKRLY
jgi:hypothetical protein